MEMVLAILGLLYFLLSIFLFLLMLTESAESLVSRLVLNALIAADVLPAAVLMGRLLNQTSHAFYAGAGVVLLAVGLGLYRWLIAPKPELAQKEP